MMRVALSGATGFIGSAIVSRFKEEGFMMIPLVRPQTKDIGAQMTIRWDPDAGRVDAAALEGLDAIIHLGGASIAGGRWTSAYKKLIFESRIKSTDLLSQTIVKLRNPPKIFLCASAMGFYGTGGPTHVFDETSAKGEDFLSDLCGQWEKATKSTENAGVRVVQMRFAMVLGKGGALAKMLPVFKMGLGGPLGSGKQIMSWIALPEIPAIILDLMRNSSLRGPINMVSPNPVSNAEFTKILGSVVKRPAVFPVPALGIKLLFGEMGKTLLLEGANVYPRRLLKSGYRFQYPDLKMVLEGAISSSS